MKIKHVRDTFVSVAINYFVNFHYMVIKNIVFFEILIEMLRNNI
jgi:hypothetical protein